MKKVVLAVMLILLAGEAFGQITSRFEYLLRSAGSGRLVGGKDVDLWQGGSKVYDLSEYAATPGWYYHTGVRYGEYDIYVDSTSFRTGVWIGSEKIKTVVDRIFDSSEISGLVSRDAIVQASDSVDASLISMAVTAGSYTSIASGRSGSGTFLPLTFWSNGSERMRLLTDGQFRVSSRLLVGGSSTDASLSAGVFIGNLTVASGATNASILNFSNAFGESTVEAGRTGSGTYQPLVLRANGADVMRLTTAGQVQMRREAAFPAIAGFPSTVSGPTLDTLHVREEIFAFDDSGSDTLFFDWSVPWSFRQIDSVAVITSTANADGDSSGWRLVYRSRGNGSALGGALDSARTLGQVDMGAGGVQIRKVSAGVTFGGISAGKLLIWAIIRDNGISNNVAAAVRLHYVIIYWS